ncbi:probable inactive leucine-rich repeat receptor-like protein kinase At3g03770 isoform X2 [Cornus florida]|uniref:probable inactive leucine-rich repeat receptor-like protein kinase At3g03770 isoform X2 n=1 Tax=Cornus florida TaxID=4283 RepID=UPI00289A9BC0|nr:probable inactive leucine-rich repeat receptor-like protein kinase At3g03770 isoform X2 [Cornus florida]
MANPFHQSLLLLFFMVFLSIQHSSQLQPSQSQALLKIKQLLNYPLALSSWSEERDFCNIEPNPSITLVCYEDSITQLHIFGNNGFSQTRHSLFTESFFSNLASLPSLKVLSLVSLGLWGPLPNSVGSLSSLEILNISSNYLSGTIPMEVLSLRSLQTLILDHNMFTGEVPHWLSTLPMLAVLSFMNNSLTGYLPNSLSSMENLRILRASRNHLFGEVPNLCNLTNLQTLDLEDNNFGPHFPNVSTKLMTLVLRKNRFRFGLPANLSSYYQLQKLDVSLNEFVGPFSPSLLSLPSLYYLDVAENRFRGMLFRNMSCNAELVFVNLSSNRLTGELPACLEWGFNSRVVQCDGNCLSNSSQKQHPYLYCHNEALAVKIMPREQEKSPVHRGVLAAGLVGGIVAGIALSGLVFSVTRRVSGGITIATCQRDILEKVSPAYTMKLLSAARYISETMKMGALGLPPYRTFVLEELKEATNDFSKSNVIGEGSYGQVYKGWLIDGTVVAITSLKMRKRHNIQTYTHQIELISKLRHSHLVCAIGHCFECYPDDSSVSRIFLVFEFVPNGTLRGWISERLPGQIFSWTQRMTAAIEIARGIQFLHTGTVPGVFSNNLKITDVFMDQNLHAKISSYNLPLLSENKRQVGDAASSTVTQENVRGRVRHADKDDVYDLGVILLEIIVGRPILSKNDISVAKDLLQVSLTADEVARRSIVDPAIRKECSDESLKTTMENCVRCLSNEPTDRPSVEDVLWNLQFAAQVQDSWRGDSKSSQGSPIMCSI